MSDQRIAKLQIPECFEFLLEPHRYKVAYGGRGGAKSWAYAKTLLALAVSSPLRILCAREVQKSIKESVHQLLEDQIKALGLSSHFEVLKTEINCVNGSKFIFSGLSDQTATSIKSFEGIDRVWVEEAQAVTKRSWEILIPTIRKEGSEIWVSLNPDLEEDETYQRFIVDPPDSAKVVKVGWRDNPWFPDVLKDEKDYLAKVDPDAYSHIWEGNCVLHSDDQVLAGKVSIEEFTPETEWDGPYLGADWGFSQDPTTLVKCWINGRSLYIEHEAWGLGVDIDATPSLFDSVPGARQYMITADNARPETISYMNKHGFKVRSCEKGKGSVEDGVAHMRSYEEIVIHPRCKYAIEESKLYRYKRDRLTNEVTTVILDKHNHIMDAIRYALEAIMKYGKRKHKPAPPKRRGSWQSM